MAEVGPRRQTREGCRLARTVQSPYGPSPDGDSCGRVARLSLSMIPLLPPLTHACEQPDGVVSDSSATLKLLDATARPSRLYIPTVGIDCGSDHVPHVTRSGVTHWAAYGPKVTLRRPRLRGQSGQCHYRAWGSLHGFPLSLLSFEERCSLRRGWSDRRAGCRGCRPLGTMAWRSSWYRGFQGRWRGG